MRATVWDLITSLQPSTITQSHKQARPASVSEYLRYLGFEEWILWVVVEMNLLQEDGITIGCRKSIPPSPKSRSGTELEQ